MRFIKKTITIGAYLLVFTQLTSCFALLLKGGDSSSYKKTTVETGAVPPEFGENKASVMIIVMHEKDAIYNKRTKKNVAGTYFGKHEFATLSELEQKSKFEDTSKYRFYFFFQNDGTNYQGTGYQKKFFVYDRKENKKYLHPFTAEGWINYQKGYLRGLNDHL